MAAARAASASAYVPTLFATSPFAATRSVPAITASASPRRISPAAALSTISSNGKPARSSSHSVSRAPSSSGRVSHASTRTSGSRRCSSRITASAVPSPPAASAPVLQIVSTRRALARRSAPWRAIAALAASSSAWMRWASARAAAAIEIGPAAIHAARTRSTAHARFTAVGRAANKASAPDSRDPRPGCRATSIASPYAATIPMSGAPRTASRRIAAAVSSAPVRSSQTSRAGSAVWSRTDSARPSQRSATALGLATATRGLASAQVGLDPERSRCGIGRRLGRGGRGGRLDAERLVQLAGLVHLGDDVAAADQLALDEELRDRRPVRQRRQLLPDPRVGQDVDGGERRAGRLQRLDRAHGEAARRHLGRALHEEDDLVVADRLGDRVAEGVLGLLGHGNYYG